MKEKTADIDILEDFIELKELYSNNNIRKSFLSIYQEAVKNLISENKELKEFKENIEKIDKKQLDKLYEDAQKALKEYRETQNKVAKLEAENKELKEEKDSLKKEVIHWKGEYHLENRKYLDLYNKKVSIPTINATEEMLEQYVEKVKIIKDIEELEDYIQHSANPLSIDNSKFAIKVLQSLLGKE